MTIVAFDTETKGLDPFNPDQQAFLLSWADAQGSHVCDVHDPDGVAAFRRAVDDASTLVAHNLPFDLHQVRETLGLDLLTAGKTLLDTNEFARVAIPERKFGTDDDYEGGRSGYRLKDLAKTYLRTDADAAEQKIAELAKSAGIKLKATGGYYDTWRAYPADMERYALLDAEYARDLLPVLDRKLRPSCAPIWELERKVQPHLIRAEQRGVAVDQERVAPLKVEYERRAEEAHDLVTRELGDDALEGRDALLEALQSHGVPLYRTTPTGVLATNQAALAEFEGQFPVLAALSEWRTASKFLSTYIDRMVDRDVVHCSFNQQGAWTGRMSCSSPNMQNIPVRSGSEVREMFVPRPGHCFVVCDYDSIELRLLAYYLNDEGFKEKIERGDDVFSELAAILPNRAHGDDPTSYRKGAPGQGQRGGAKNTTYAITYGAGAGKVSDMQDPPLDPGPFYGPDHPAIVEARARGKWWPKEGWQYAEGRALVSTVKGWLPGYHRLNGRIKKKVQAEAHVTTIMGRYQPVNADKAYIGLNALIQGSAADIMKQGIINVAQAVKPLGALPVLFVHDEVVVETPIEHASEVLLLTKAAMNAAYRLSPRLEVSGTICLNNYGEAK